MKAASGFQGIIPGQHAVMQPAPPPCLQRQAAFYPTRRLHQQPIFKTGSREADFGARHKIVKLSRCVGLLLTVFQDRKLFRQLSSQGANGQFSNCVDLKRPDTLTA